MASVSNLRYRVRKLFNSGKLNIYSTLEDLKLLYKKNKHTYTRDGIKEPWDTNTTNPDPNQSLEDWIGFCSRYVFGQATWPSGVDVHTRKLMARYHCEQNLIPNILALSDRAKTIWDRILLAYRRSGTIDKIYIKSLTDIQDLELCEKRIDVHRFVRLPDSAIRFTYAKFKELLAMGDVLIEILERGIRPKNSKIYPESKYKNTFCTALTHSKLSSFRLCDILSQIKIQFPTFTCDDIENYIVDLLTQFVSKIVNKPINSTMKLFVKQMIVYDTIKKKFYEPSSRSELVEQAETFAKVLGVHLGDNKVEIDIAKLILCYFLYPMNTNDNHRIFGYRFINKPEILRTAYMELRKLEFVSKETSQFVFQIFCIKMLYIAYEINLYNIRIRMFSTNTQDRESLGMLCGEILSTIPNILLIHVTPNDFPTYIQEEVSRNSVMLKDRIVQFLNGSIDYRTAILEYKRTNRIQILKAPDLFSAIFGLSLTTVCQSNLEICKSKPMMDLLLSTYYPKVKDDFHNQVYMQTDRVSSLVLEYIRDNFSTFNQYGKLDDHINGVFTKLIVASTDVIFWALKKQHTSAFTKQRIVHGPNNTKVTWTFISILDEVKLEYLVNGIETSVKYVIDRIMEARKVSEDDAKKSDKPLFVSPVGDISNHMVQVKSSYELWWIGMHMNVCTYSYMDACSKGTSYIYKVCIDDAYTLVELNINKINNTITEIQHRGFANSAPEPAFEERLKIGLEVLKKRLTQISQSNISKSIAAE